LPYKEGDEGPYVEEEEKWITHGANVSLRLRKGGIIEAFWAKQKYKCLHVDQALRRTYIESSMVR